MSKNGACAITARIANGKEDNDDDDKEDSSIVETTTLKEEKTGDFRYGCFGYKPPCLQWLNTVGGFVFWLCMANCLLTMSCAFYGVVLSTMERRFGFSSSESSWIAAACEIGPIPVLLLISYFGNRLHRPVSCAIGMFSIFLGAILFFVPQFTSPLYHPDEKNTEEQGGGTELCSERANSTSGCHEVVPRDPSVNIAIFFIARLLMGAGSTPVQTLGVTYMDDCTTRGKFAVYTGVYHAMSIAGSALAYVGGGFMLKIFVDFYAFDKEEINMSPSDSSWIGAWWLPFTIMAGLSLLNAIPMLGYPVDLPGTAEIRKTRISEAHNGDLGDASHKIGYITTWGEFKQLFKNVLTNPTYLCLTTYVTTHNFMVEGFSSFGPKVFEVQFNLSKSLAGAIFGVVLLPAGAGGTIIGGLLIEKLKLTCRQIIRIQTILAGVATLGFCLMLLTCNPLDFAGVNIPYNHSISSSSGSCNLTDSCNAACDCQSANYNPICSHDNVIYYSPCHAGCSVTEDLDDVTNYYNCSCIESPSGGGFAEASSNSCSAESCSIAIVFMVAFFVTVTLVFICFTMNMTATLRCVSSSQTSFAIGIQYLFSQTFGSILGPLFMGMAFDNACVLWHYDQCGSSGNCFAYDNRKVSVNFFIILFTAKVISLVVMILAVILYKPPKAAQTLIKDNLCSLNPL